MSGSGSPADKAGSFSFGRAWENIPMGDHPIPKKADVIKMEGGIRTLYHGTGDPSRADKPKGFIAPGSPHHPGAFDRRIGGHYTPKGAPSMRMMADAQPKKEPKPAAPYKSAKLEGDGVRRNSQGQLEAKYQLKDPDTKTLTLEGRNGARFPFKVSPRPTDSHTQPVKVGNKTYFLNPKDSDDFQFVQHLYSQGGTAPKMKVA